MNSDWLALMTLDILLSVADTIGFLVNTASSVDTALASSRWS
jgi:hypothetical protein